MIDYRSNIEEKNSELSLFQNRLFKLFSSLSRKMKDIQKKVALKRNEKDMKSLTFYSLNNLNKKKNHMKIFMNFTTIDISNLISYTAIHPPEK